MEVEFTPEQEAQNRPTKRHQPMVRDAVLRLLDEDAEFRAGIRRGIEQANRGDLIDHEEVNASFNKHRSVDENWVD